MKLRIVQMLNGLLLLLASLPVTAHSSVEAMQQQGGNLHSLLAALIHPIVESGYLLMAAGLAGVYLWLAVSLVAYLATKSRE